jgi:hypothetical protein
MNTESPESPLKIQSLDEFGAYMTKEKVAKALGIATHNIPPLVREGLIKPFGHPQRYCVKLYSRDVLARQLADVVWLEKVAAAIHEHWRRKNARRQNQLKKSP